MKKKYTKIQIIYTKCGNEEEKHKDPDIYNKRGNEDKGGCCKYGTVQGSLLTPLTLAQHRLSPLAAFTSGTYFLHNGRRWQWICEFYTANFKGIFGGPSSECVWQQAMTCCSCYRMPQNAFSPWTRYLLVSQKMTQRHLFSTLHLLSSIIFATATVVAFVLLCNSRFNFHC